MKPIFRYIDYRVYLEDFRNEKKKSTRHFSYRFFMEKAGIKSPVFLKLVIDGKRNLTRQMIDKFIPALNLSDKEGVFFRNLVLFNQAKTALEKQEHYSVMLSMMDSVHENQLTKDHYSYFEVWYNSVIRELVCIFNFQDNFDLIARTVYPQIKISEVKKAINLLLRLKLITKQKDGSYQQTETAIISNDPMVALARRSFNSEMVRLAKNANETLTPSERNISGITMGISKSCYDVIVTEMMAFKERIKMIVKLDDKTSCVYQLNLQLFPLSTNVSELKPPESGSEVCGE